MLNSTNVYCSLNRWLRYPLIMILINLSACVSHTGIKRHSHDHYPQVKSAIFFSTEDYPDCVIILPAKGIAFKKHGLIIEDVLTRHFQVYFNRIISPSTRKHIVKNRAYNLTSLRELKHFSRSTDCNYGLLASVKKLNASYAIAYALRSFEVSLQLIKLDGNSIIWQENHSGTRSAGGLPTGPLGLVMNVNNANQFMNDADGLEALVEDVVRQLSKRFFFFKKTFQTLH